MESMYKNNYIIANILISLVIASRFIPELGQYTPVFAVLMLTAMVFEKKYMYIKNTLRIEKPPTRTALGF